MHRELLDILVNPIGRDTLTLEAEGDGDGDGAEILSGELIAGDGSRFAIREGVPRMVPGLSSVTEDDGATQRSFGAKWDQYREEEKDQLADFQENWFDARFGFSGDSGLEEFLAGRRVLDAGTGPGICAARCARLTTERVVGMDLSESVTAAQRRYAAQANLDYVQGTSSTPLRAGELRFRDRRPGAPSHP